MRSSLAKQQQTRQITRPNAIKYAYLAWLKLFYKALAAVATTWIQFGDTDYEETPKKAAGKWIANDDLASRIDPTRWLPASSSRVISHSTNDWAIKTQY